MLIGSDWDDWPAVPPVNSALTPNEDDGITFDPRGISPLVGDASAGHRLALVWRYLAIIARCLADF